MPKSSVPDKAYDHVKVGRSAPVFDLKDQAGNRHRLKDYRGRWVVLYFYPKDNTSGCTKQACQFRDRTSELKDRDVVVLGVSPDDEKSHTKFIDKHDLPFDLLADVDTEVCGKYGVWQEKSMYGRKYMGVVRTTFLIDPDGKIAQPAELAGSKQIRVIQVVDHHIGHVIAPEQLTLHTEGWNTEDAPFDGTFGICAEGVLDPLIVYPGFHIVDPQHPT